MTTGRLQDEHDMKTMITPEDASDNVLVGSSQISGRLSNDVFYERQKIVGDYFKHVTTLSTGSILLVVTILDKIAAKPGYQFLVPIGLISLAATLVGAFYCYTWSAFAYGYDPYVRSPKTMKLFHFTRRALFVSFSVGIIALALFALMNLI